MIVSPDLFAISRQFVDSVELSNAHGEVACRMGRGVYDGIPPQLRLHGRSWNAIPHGPSDSGGGRRLGGAAMTTRAFLVLMGLAWLAPLTGVAATAPIYKCVDANLRVLYTDMQCKDGEQLNIRAGDADPVAMARLQRERDALDQSAAQRIADQKRQNNWAGQYLIEDNQRAYGYPPYNYGVGWWLPDAIRAHPPNARGPKAHESRHFAPMSPSSRTMSRH